MSSRRAGSGVPAHQPTRSSMRLRSLILAAAILAANTATGATCLVVRDNNVKKVHASYGITTAAWTGEVHNTCRRPYDAILTVKFEDGEGRVVYKDVQVVIVTGGGSEKARRRIDIPSDRYNKIQNIDVGVDERERLR